MTIQEKIEQVNNLVISSQNAAEYAEKMSKAFDEAAHYLEKAKELADKSFAAIKNKEELDESLELALELAYEMKDDGRSKSQLLATVNYSLSLLNKKLPSLSEDERSFYINRDFIKNALAALLLLYTEN